MTAYMHVPGPIQQRILKLMLFCLSLIYIRTVMSGELRLPFLKK